MIDPPTATTPLRDPQIDFWRGLALVMIFINHIPNNPVTLITLRHFGFADAAEIFVFLAGVSAALTIGRKFDRDGVVNGMIYAGQRIWRLFRAHIMLVFGLSLLIASAGLVTDSVPVKQEFNFIPLFFETDKALLKLVRFAYMPNMTDILPLYVLLLALFPLFWFLRRHALELLLVLSGCAWLAATLYGAGPNRGADGLIWTFNPLAWQFLFVLGIVAAGQRAAILAQLHHPFWTTAALAMTIFAALAAAPWVMMTGWEDGRIIPPWVLSYNDKTDLSLLRLLHFAALVFLGMRGWPWLAAHLPERVTATLSMLGRNALVCFCGGVMLSMALHIIHIAWLPARSSHILTSVAGLALLIALTKCFDLLRVHARNRAQTTLG